MILKNEIYYLSLKKTFCIFLFVYLLLYTHVDVLLLYTILTLKYHLSYCDSIVKIIIGKPKNTPYELFDVLYICMRSVLIKSNKS